MTPSQMQFDALLRGDFGFFFARAFAHVDPQTPFSHNWHHDLICDRLRQFYEGGIRRLIINVPPRSGKSICASVALPAWVLGQDPGKRIICASYGQDLALKHARDTQSVMLSPWYQRAFATRLHRARNAAADFQTTAHGGRKATSVGGPLTGLGGDLFVIDDPVKPDEALSEVQRRTANDWFDQTLYSRLNDKRTGGIAIIMQRLHMDDMVGHVLEKSDDWDMVSLPMIADEDEVWDYRTIRGPVRRVRREGELLHPSREPQWVVDSLRDAMGTYVFSAQYQQAPVPMGGALVQREWLRFYEPSELPPRFDRIVQSWDSANKESEFADYSVCTTWGVKAKRMFLLDVLRRRMEYPALKKAVIAHAEGWKATAVLIEDKASGTQLAQELRNTVRGVRAIKSEHDKVMRMGAQTPEIEAGNVLLPKEATWLAPYIDELTAFPKAKYDDQVDSTAQAIKWITGEGRVPDALQFFRDIYEANHGHRWEDRDDLEVTDSRQASGP